MHSRSVTRLFALQRHLARPARISSLRSQIRMSSSSHEPAPAAEPVSTKDATRPEPPKFNFPVSEIPKNPLGEGRYIKSAACLIIGCVSIRLVSHNPPEAYEMPF